MRALVTGAGSGIGRATAAALAGRGYEVTATARTVEDLAEVPAAARLRLDVTDPDSVEALVAAVPEVDVVVNNAGIVESGPVERYPLDALQRMFDTNVLGPVRVIQAYLPGLRERGAGTVVNVTSVEGRVAAPLAGVYSATKHALEALSEALHLEVGHFGVRVVIVEPGYIAPGMKPRRAHGEHAPYDELREQMSGTDARLLGGPRPGPEVVAETIVDAIETGEPKLRWPVGEDAEMVLGARHSLDDAAFEAAMRDVLGLTW